MSSFAAQLSARERIDFLLDDNSFVEIGSLITKRSTDFNLQAKEAPADGVITGYGLISGGPVYVYSQDIKSLGGTLGEMHSKKIINIYDLALKVGAPVIGLIDCGGLRLQEATDALAGLGEIYYKQVMSSGVILQVAAVFGTCGGGMAISGELSDFVFMEQKHAKFYINTPDAIEGNNSLKLDTSSAGFKAKAGMVDIVQDGDEKVLDAVRRLVGFLPGCNGDEPLQEECRDDINRLAEGFDAYIMDPVPALSMIADDGFFMEIKEHFAKDMVTGFLRLNGMSIGVLANRAYITGKDGKAAETFDNALSCDACYKAAHFVKVCDAFHIPVLTLTNVNGFKAALNEEKSIAAAAAKLTYAFANATVPKVNLITGKAYKSAYIIMNSKHIGADLVFALENTEIGAMEADLAAQIIYEHELKKAKDRAAFLKEKTDEYAKLVQSAESAAGRGYVDQIIEAPMVRKHLIYAFEMLKSKREDRPARKHGTV